MNMGNASARELLPLCLFQGTHAGEEPFVISLEMASVTIHPSNDMSEFTAGKPYEGHLCGKALSGALGLATMKQSSLERNRVHVTCAEEPQPPI